jgi:hypothetical protein
MRKLALVLVLVVFVATPLAARTLKVNCSNPRQTVNGALASAQPGDTIQVQGVCKEAVSVQIDGVTLDGLGTATVDGTGSNQAAITIMGAVRVAIQNLTVQNGLHGIRALREADVGLSGIVARNNTQTGISIAANSSAGLKNCTVETSGTDGIAVGSSSVLFDGTITSRNNGGNGIGIYSSGVTFMSGSNIAVNSNQGVGISVSGTLTANAATITVSSNIGQGIFVYAGQAGFNGSTTVAQNNGSWGVQIGQGSVSVSNGTMTSSGNQQDGMGIFEHSNFMLLGNATLTVTQNARHGINLYTDSSFHNLYNGTLVIQNNPKTGMAIFDGSSARLLNGHTTISGNPEAGIGLFRGSRLEYDLGNSIDKISHDDTVIINGALQYQPTRTFAVCAGQGAPMCGCGDGRLITQLPFPCSVTSDAGACSMDSGWIGEGGSCCVCAP